jgi:hypothetical protein
LRTLRGALPAELADRLRMGAAPVESQALPRLATGVEAVDALLGGGVPRGRLVEITGPPSSGRTSLALALLASATRAREVAAVVDAADAFDAASADAAGAARERVVWVRAPRAREALRCAERLLEARGFGLVLLDLAQSPAEGARDAASAIWARLAKGAQASGTALVLLSTHPRVGPFAALTLAARATRARFAAQPGWLDGLDAEIAPLRSRIGTRAGTASVAWTTRAG